MTMTTSKEVAIVGIDPDSSKVGVAVWVKGVFINIKSYNIFDLQDYLIELKEEYTPVLSIEDICKRKSGFTANKATKGYSDKKRAKVSNTVAQGIGKCKKSQQDVELLCKRLKLDFVHVEPASQWKTEKEIPTFKAVTLWEGKSNADSRSAAYMVIQAIKQRKVKFK